LIAIRACKNKGGDAKDVFCGYFRRVWCESLELEGIYADGNGAHQTVIKFLVELFIAG